jgi:hypothetical protein
MELRALAQPNGASILYDRSGRIEELTQEASQYGVSAVLDSSTGQGYLLWRSTKNEVNILDLRTGERKTCSDPSFSTPTAAVFRRQLFVAWRGPDNRISIATLKPF